MPAIKPYRVQTQSANVPEVRQASTVAFGQAGAGMQGLADAGLKLAEVIQKRNEQAELSDLHVNFSKTQTEWTLKYQKELQEGTLDVEAFNKDFSDSMDAVQENVSTRAGRLYYDQASAELKGHFLEKTAIGQAQLAGAKAKSNYLESVSANSSTLLNDPSSFEMLNKMQQQGIQNLVTSRGLPAAQAEELKLQSQRELAKSAIRGWTNLNPEDAKKQLNEGLWDKTIDGDLKNQLLGEADQAIRGRAVEDERLKRQQKEILAQQQTDTQNKFLSAMAEDKLSAKEILNSNLDPFGSGSKEQFIKLLEQHDKQKSERIKTDPNVFMDLWDKVHLPDGDPQKVNDENYLNQFMGRGLTVSDINTLRGEIQGKKTIAGSDEAELKKGITDIAKGKLTKSNPLTGIRDPIGDTQYQKFLVNFLSDFNKQRQEGKSAKQLLSPESPDYLGKNIDRYTRTNQQIITDLVKINKSATPMATPPPPRQPGESAAAYLKRTGK